MHFWDEHKIITCYYEQFTKPICDKYKKTRIYRIRNLLRN